MDSIEIFRLSLGEKVGVKVKAPVGELPGLSRGV